MKPTSNPLTLLNNPTLWKHLCNVNSRMSILIDQTKDMLPCSKKLVPHFNRAKHMHDYRICLETYLLVFKKLVMTASRERVYFVEAIEDEWAKLEGVVFAHIDELELLVNSLPVDASA